MDQNEENDPEDVQFVADSCQVVVDARKVLSYAYPLRYFLNGKNKQAAFDKLLQELERSLELLTFNTEAHLGTHVDYDAA